MEIEIRHITFELDKELEQLVELQDVVYAFRGLRFAVDRFKRWYLDNPLGKVLSYCAFDGDKMVSHYACTPTQMMIDGKIVNGVHSMAVVTHPDYRGKGLFKTLASKTYELAKELGYEFVTGVANANSFSGFMKYFPFVFIGRLDVKWGWGEVRIPEKVFSKYWSVETLGWRLGIHQYSSDGANVYGFYGKYPFIKTWMGHLPENFSTLLKKLPPPSIFRPLNLYVGIGADLSKGHYFDIPKCVSHSPFNLRFMDITPDHHLAAVTKDNIVFQLIDFDVA